MRATFLGLAVTFVAARAAAGAADPREAAPDGGGADAVPTYALPVVELRAPLLPDPLGPFPLATRRLGREAVARRPGADLGEVLRSVAGVRVTSSGSPEASAAVSIRGATGAQVLVLVDDRRLNPAQGGGLDLATVPLESVESVEVFRGGASAVWGSDALGGAIHVRTRKPAPGTGRLRLGVGSHGERNVSGRGAIALGGGWSAQASSRFFETAGDYAFLDDRRGTESTVRNGDLRRWSGDVRLDGEVGKAFDLRVDVSGVSSERGVPGSEEFPTPTARLEDDRAVLGLRAQAFPGRGWGPALDLSYVRMDRRYREPEAAFGPVDESHRNERWEGEGSAVFLGDGTAWRFATGVARDRLGSTTDGRRDRVSGNLRARVSRDHRIADRSVRWMGAARVDATQDFTPFVSPRVGVLVDVWRERAALRLSAGLSHRTPSFDELFWPARATAAGNPDLRAERGRDVDVGISLRGLPGRGELAVDGFWREVDDLIQWTPGASGIWRPHNVGRARLAGIEVETGFELPLPFGVRGDAAGSATFLDTRDLTGAPNVDGKRLLYRPRWTGSVGLVARKGPGEIETVWRWIDDVFVTRANTKTLSGYALGEIRARWHLGPRLELDAAVTNLTDETARDFRDYPLPGRSWKLGLSIERGRR